MLKVKNIPELFLLRNKWHDQLEAQLKIKNYPFKFKIAKEPVAISDKIYAYPATDEERKKKITLMIGETALKYLAAKEVPDCNMGAYFEDYLPCENSMVVFSHKGKIIPAKFVLNIETVSYDEKETILLDLVMKNIMTGAIHRVDCLKRCMWKFIVYNGMIEYTLKTKNIDKIAEPDKFVPLEKKAEAIAQYMDDMETMVQDTIIHKTIVNHIMNRFADLLMEEAGKHLSNPEYNVSQSDEDSAKADTDGIAIVPTNYNYAFGLYESPEEMLADADMLRAEGANHDNSKLLNKTEFQALTSIINDKTCLRDPNMAFSAYKQDVIELHWKNNEHHPEHYEKPQDMPRVRRIEFVCDCYARSLQYGTELLDFMNTRQVSRFHFPDDMFGEIMGYCTAIMAYM